MRPEVASTLQPARCSFVIQNAEKQAMLRSRMGREEKDNQTVRQVGWKNKGGRPKTQTWHFNRQVTLCLPDEEYGAIRGVFIAWMAG